MTSRLLTIGYESRSVDELIADLTAASVTLLVDVRQTPMSRKTGMSKTRLAAALAEAGIGYLHLRDLGNPKENRAAFRRGAPEAWESLRSRLTGGAGANALAQVADLVGSETVALLCFEHDPATCHRTLVAEEVSRLNPDLTVVPL